MAYPSQAGGLAFQTQDGLLSADDGATAGLSGFHDFGGSQADSYLHFTDFGGHVRRGGVGAGGRSVPGAGVPCGRRRGAGVRPRARRGAPCSGACDVLSTRSDRPPPPPPPPPPPLPCAPAGRVAEQPCVDRRPGRRLQPAAGPGRPDKLAEPGATPGRERQALAAGAAACWRKRRASDGARRRRLCAAPPLPPRSFASMRASTTPRAPRRRSSCRSGLARECGSAPRCAPAPAAGSVAVASSS
jgi:hypothetical protein